MNARLTLFLQQVLGNEEQWEAAVCCLKPDVREVILGWAQRVAPSVAISPRLYPIAPFFSKRKIQFLPTLLTRKYGTKTVVCGLGRQQKHEVHVLENLVLGIKTITHSDSL